MCPLCYEEGHKKKDCPEKPCDPIRRCFKCNEVGHFKVNCPKGKNKGDTFRGWYPMVLGWLKAQQIGALDVWKWGTSKQIVQRVKAQ